MSGLRLNNRRGFEIVEFVHAGMRFRGGVGDGGKESRWTAFRRRLAGAIVGGAFSGPREIWLTPDVKSGTGYEAIAQDLGVAASLALRHGCPVADLRDALAKDAKGAPAGPLGVLLRELDAGGD